VVVQILVDNPNSWIVPYAEKLIKELILRKINCPMIHRHEDIEPGDILILLSCEQILKKMNLNRYNLVVHESDLPEGKGWSPVTWQILEGKNLIPIVLFEAAEKVDAGQIYLKDYLSFEGHELIDEIRQKQGNKTVELILKFIDQYPNIKGSEQKGNSTYYPRRKPQDSELQIDKTIFEQFNLLRVCDNDRYPAYFIKDGVKYKIKIEKYD
jgi:methionyl-tRNA formyltransferase